MRHVYPELCTYGGTVALTCTLAHRNEKLSFSGDGASNTALRRAEVFVADVKYFRKRPILHFTDVFSWY